MDNVPTCSWDDIVPPLPSNSFPATGYTDNLANVPSNRSRSPSWATTSPASSPAPSRQMGTTTTSRTLPDPPIASEIDYIALSEHLPTLYAAFESSPDATQALQEVIELVMQEMQPSDSIINRLVLHDADEYRCSVSTCERHIEGTGWTRLDRARGHFRTEHLGSHFPCRAPGCDVWCRRLSDLREHQKSHQIRPPRFYCEYCHRSYAKRSNLNRHIEIGHRMRAPRRIRRRARR